MFLDGVQVGTPDTSPATSLAASTETLKIGYGRVAGADRYFDCQIDDVKGLNYALTAIEIQLEFNQSSAVRFGPLTGSP